MQQAQALSPSATIFHFMLKSILAVSIGGSIGCLLRWQLSERLNALLPNIALGTLTVNLIGGYVVGLAIGCLSTATDLAPEWRLLIITGFCGGLTTFSSFSAEIVLLLQQGRSSWALCAIAIHLFGSLLLTWAGLTTWQLVQTR